MLKFRSRETFRALLDIPYLAVVVDHGRVMVDRVPGHLSDEEVARHVSKALDEWDAVQLDRAIDAEFRGIARRAKRRWQ